VSRQPINLRVLNHSEGDQHIDIAWNCNNAYAAQGFTIEWSTDGTNFTEIDRVGVNTTSYSDTNIQRGTYYYRVRSFNALGTSRPSNVDSVVIGNPHFPATIDHSTDFASHGDLTANGTGRFSPNAVAVGTFVGANDIGNTARAGGASFDPASRAGALEEVSERGRPRRIFRSGCKRAGDRAISAVRQRPASAPLPWVPDRRRHRRAPQSGGRPRNGSCMLRSGCSAAYP